VHGESIQFGSLGDRFMVICEIVRMYTSLVCTTRTKDVHPRRSGKLMRHCIVGFHGGWCN
jgi:hypothetical protein